jgi:PAS domain S-box-containing protein
MGLLERIVSTDFMPHGYCFLWLPEILWLHAVSDGLIALSYFAIPAALVILVLRRRGEVPFPWLFGLFAAFIVACGLTHVMGIWTIWRPDYGAAGLVKGATALVSVATAASLVPVLPRALALWGPRELELLVGARTAELAAGEARYRALVEAIGTVVWTTDPEGRVADMPGWRAITGQTGDEVRGWGWLDAVHPEDREATRAAWARAVATRGAYAVEYRVRDRGGAWRWYAVRGVPVPDGAGGVREWVGVCVDVDERRRAEADLRESEERYRVLVETSPDAVYLHQDGVVVLANPQAAAVLGARDPADLLGRPALSLVDEASLPLARERTARMTVPGARAGLAELTYRRLDGRPVPVEADAAAVLIGGRLAVQVAFRDIAERKAAQEHQRLLLAELSHRVKNTLAVVQGIAAQSLSGGRSLAEAREVLTKRLRALANAHTLLTASEWQGASLEALVAAELEPYEGRAEVAGGDVTLSPKEALTLSLVLHELATNAAKHGALSAPGGRVEVGWEVAGEAPARTLRLRWRERGGPPVPVPPSRRGFGRALVEQAVAYDLKGRGRLDFRPDGVAYELEAELGAGAAAAAASDAVAA